MSKKNQSTRHTIGYVLLESVLIGMSILAAFWLENYRENTESEHIKYEYYKRLHTDLALDTRQLQKLKSNAANQIERIDKILEILDQKNTNIDTLTLLINMTEQVFLNNNFYKLDDRFTINSIINSEQGKIFKRDNTFLLITQYYQARSNFVNGIKVFHSYCEQNLTPYIDQFFDRSAIGNTTNLTHKPNYSLANFKTNHFKNLLISTKERIYVASWFDYIINFNKNVLKSVGEEIKNYEDYLSIN